MKFTVGRDALGEAVAFISRALPSRPVVPVLSGMLVEASQDGLILSCFDYEVSARVRVDAEVTATGTALVPGRLLAEITRSLPDQPAEFAADGDVVNLRCGQAEFGLVCLPTEDYPALPDSPDAVGTVDAGVLAGAVAQVAAAASRDDTLPMLTAICMDIAGDVLTLAATDRYRLAAREVAFAPADPLIRALALVPARIMVDVARTFPQAGPITVAFELGRDPSGAEGTLGARFQDDRPRPAEGLVSFESGDRRFTARLIAGEFIRYKSRFGEEFACRAELPAVPVIEAVRRAALVAERAGPVRLSFSHDHVVIEAHAEGRARAAESVAAEFAGDEPVISFNPAYLLDGLTAAASGAAAAGSGGPGSASADGRGAGDSGSARDPEPVGPGRVRLEFNTAAKPALITWTADEEHDGVPAFRYLLVPLRVPERT
ncbi:MAG: DNA polymerase III subunit beta [Nocardiopsaceae bacterium]|jgi:DNA polymerase-3 subunit beta|nr:DNA polymerase III subunit beta [Nocardiopsaceae bacterium]